MRDLSDNERELLTIIWKSGSIPRADVSRSTRLAQQSVHRLLDGLLAEELISLGEAEVRGRGKPSPNVFINRARFVSLGLCVHVHTVRYALLDLSGKPVETGTIDAPANDCSAVLDAVDRLIAGWGASPRQLPELLGIGVAIDAQRGEDGAFRTKSALSSWSGAALRQNLERRYSRPAFAELSGACSALAEYYFGNAREYGCHAYFAISHSFAAGLVHQRQIFTGHRGNAADISRLFMPERPYPRPPLNGFAAANLADRAEVSPRYPEDLRRWLDELRPDLLLAARALHAVADVGAIYLGGEAPKGLRQTLATALASSFGAQRLTGPQILVSAIDGDAAHLGAALLPLHQRIY